MAGDPYWGDTVLLLDMEGVNGGVLFTDKVGKTITNPSGQITTSTTAPKFGSSSGYFDGSVGYLYEPTNHVDLRLHNKTFTMEAWVKVSGGSGLRVIFGKAGSGAQSYFLHYDGSGIGFIYTADGYSGSSVSTYGSATLTVGTWYHVAVTRSGSNIKIYLDGVQIASRTDASMSWYDSSVNFRIGAIEVSGYEYRWNGYIDEVRITTGVVRYTSDFSGSLPSAPFGDRYPKISGVTKNASNVLESKLVRLYRQDTGAFITQAVSTAVTGAFTLDAPGVLPGEKCFLVEQDTTSLTVAGGTTANAAILDNIAPV